MRNDSDIYTEKKRPSYKRNKGSEGYIIGVLVGVLVLAFFIMLFGLMYAYPFENKEKKVVSCSRDDLFVKSQPSQPLSNPYQKQQAVIWNEAKSKTANFSTSTKQTSQSNQSGRTNAQKANTKTCLYWNKKYNQEGTKYNKLMQDDACKRAGITVKIRQQNNIAVQNIYQGKQTVKRNRSDGTSRSTCTRYKQKLERVQTRMRRGYSASEYNRLETTRKKWRKKLFDECRQYSINSY